jgi:hypothetical protein
MPRPPGAFFDQRAGCWATSSLGELRETGDGRLYRTKVRNYDLRHPTRDKLAAQRWVAEELEKRARAVVPANDLSFRQLTELYLEVAENELSADAYDRRVEQLGRFGTWTPPGDQRPMDLFPCRQITGTHIRDFLAAMVSEGKSESYVTDGLLKSIKRCFSWGTSVDPGPFAGLPLPTNVAAKVKGPAIQRRPARHVNSVAVSRLIRWSWRRARKSTPIRGRFAKMTTIMMLCLRDTGARPKELCVGCWDEWEVRADGWGILTLPAWKHKTGRKTGNARVIAFPPHCARRVEWIRSLPGRHEQHIFTHQRGRGSVDADGTTAEAGEPWAWVDPVRKRTGNTKGLRRWFARLRADAIAAGVPIDPKFRLYFNRSHYSTEGQRKGVPRALLAEAMGTSERMLERNYTDLEKEDVVNVAKAVGSWRVIDNRSI